MKKRNIDRKAQAERKANVNMPFGGHRPDKKSVLGVAYLTGGTKRRQEFAQGMRPSRSVLPTPLQILKSTGAKLGIAC